jgi:hypothetical protein
MLTEVSRAKIADRTKGFMVSSTETDPHDPTNRNKAEWHLAAMETLHVSS